MPIYEYTCAKCNESFCVLQSVTARQGDAKCPKCGADDVKKKVSTFSCCTPGSGGSSGFDRNFSGG